MIKADYYEVLNVERTASDQELKSAYRKLAMQHHPDRNPDDPASEEKFKQASEAYQILSDPDKRAAYDRFGHAGVSNGMGDAGGFAGMPDLGDIFGDLFGEMFNMGGGRRSSRAQRGRDLQYELTLTFEEAVFGKQSEIEIRRMENCTICQGTGAEPGHGPTVCQQCAGRGQVRFQQGFSPLRDLPGLRWYRQPGHSSVSKMQGRRPSGSQPHHQRHRPRRH